MIYLAPDSYFEVNVSHQIKKKVVNGIRAGSNGCFWVAFEHICELLQDAFLRFRQTKWWEIMRKDLGKNMELLLYYDPLNST